LSGLWKLGFLVGLVALLALLGIMYGKRSHASEWQVRCTSYGETRPGAAVGIARPGALSVWKRTLG
jgi:hypothetical protein